LPDQIVHGLGRLVGVLVEVLDEVLVVARAADALHAGAVVLPGRPPLADRREEVPGQTVADVVRRSLAAEAAQVTDRAARPREAAPRRRPRPRVPVLAIAAGGVRDPVRALAVDLPLRVVGADVASVAGLGLPRLPQAELVPQVTPPALTRRAVRRRRADGVAGGAREVRDALAFDDGDRVARLVGREMSFRDGAILRELGLGQILRAGIGDVCWQPVPALGELRHLVLVAARAHGRRRLGEDVGAFVGHGAGIVVLHLVAVLAAHARSGHGAVPVLLHDAGGR